MRTARNGHLGGVLWFTGLSGAGKSTLAIELEQQLHERGYQVYVLDGDNLRHGVNSDLGFSPADREENIRRVGEVAGLFTHAGRIVISAFISPYRSDRVKARLVAGDEFHEVHVGTDLSVCEARDPKGLYKLAHLGKIAEFTGISAPYEPPNSCELALDTGVLSVQEAGGRTGFLCRTGITVRSPVIGAGNRARPKTGCGAIRQPVWRHCLARLEPLSSRRTQRPVIIGLDGHPSGGG